ncbi:alcohol dehydrogenase catalytic domain-containing protein, partial [Duncaniella muris]|uniref:alcohol dehydrogenase catalytic domain-containing protein n=3 Tax=Muribaculaceae TaxID=2005473 RepID=UPI0025B73EF5
MKALTYISKGRFELTEKQMPQITDPKDAIVKVTLSSICSSDLHILHGSVPQAKPGITVGHEMVGIVESVGPEVSSVRPGDRVAVNVETFCGECFFCRRGWVNNCEDPNGGWALGCRIDGGQTEYVRVPFADNCLTPIPAGVSDEQALFTGDILATGYWAAGISEISENDTVLIIGAGPTGLCTLQCVSLYNPRHIIVCETDDARRDFVRKHHPEVFVTDPARCLEDVSRLTESRGA